jgi:hypothetical protein
MIGFHYEGNLGYIDHFGFLIPPPSVPGGLLDSIKPIKKDTLKKDTIK